MQKFVEQYPELKTFQGNVSKHVAVMVEMNRKVKEEKLMAVSEAEQNLACDHDHSKAITEIMRLLGDSSVTFVRKVCMASLYHLRYEKHRNEMSTVRSVLKEQAKTIEEKRMARFSDEIVKYAGASVRGDLYRNRGFLSMVKNAFSGLSEIENVYTRYKPLLSSVLDSLLKNKLGMNDYPFMDAVGQGRNMDKVFVYVIGGTTYSEAALVSEMNKASGPSGPKIILGGSCIHNSTSFMNDVLGVSKNSDVFLDIKLDDS